MSKDSSGPPRKRPAVFDAEALAFLSGLVAAFVLPILPEKRLRTLARLVGVEVPGFRAGREPRERLVGAIGQAIRLRRSALDLVTSWLRQEEYQDLCRLVAPRTIAALKASLPRLIEKHPVGPVLLCLITDGRRGAAELAANFMAAEAKMMEEVPAAVEADGRAAAPTAAEVASPGAPAKRPRKASRVGERRLQTRVARLEAQLTKARADRDQARAEAGAAGREVGALRNQVGRLEKASASSARTPAAPPIIIETKVVSDWETRLEAARRENDRLRTQLEQAERESGRRASELREESETVERLRQALDRQSRHAPRWPAAGPGGNGSAAAPGSARSAPADTLFTDLPFEYEGPDGFFRLRASFRLLVPDSAVKGLGLVAGDLVTVKVTPDRRVELKTLVKAASESALGTVRRVGDPGAWQVVDLDGAPLGWVSEAEFAVRSLAEGDAVTVARAVASEGKPASGLWSPAVGLPVLPRCRVLSRHSVPAAEQAGEGAGEPGGRGAEGAGTARRARRAAKPAKRHGEQPGMYNGELRALREQRPLAGRKVLVVGGDSFAVGYRDIVEALGAKFESQGASRDLALVESRVRAADLVVLVTVYVSHKVSDIVTDTMKADGREPALCYAGSKGRGAILEALRPHFDERQEAAG